MGPQTVVKEESEATLLKAVIRSIETIENDYRMILSKKSSARYQI